MLIIKTLILKNPVKFGFVFCSHLSNLPKNFGCIFHNNPVKNAAVITNLKQSTYWEIRQTATTLNSAIKIMGRIMVVLIKYEKEMKRKFCWLLRQSCIDFKASWRKRKYWINFIYSLNASNSKSAYGTNTKE